MVSETISKGAGVPLKVTCSVWDRPVPVIVTTVPPEVGPELGLMSVTVEELT